jgi:CRISPR-associated Csx14 family protein
MYLISILGESPGVITEALEWLRKNGVKEEIKQIIIYTKNTKDQATILKKVLKDKRVLNRVGKVQTKFINIGINDIESEKDLENFEKRIQKILSNIKGEDIVVNISGGRKIMVIALLDLIRKLKARKMSWINIISYLSREKIAELGYSISEKVSAKIKLDDEEIEEYFFSKGNYKVFGKKIDS